MSTGYTTTNIINGAEVFGADGEKLGTVAAVYPGYIVVEKGFFFPTDYYIPMSAVASYDNDQVYLNLAKDAALNSGWDAQPTDLETATYDTSMATGTTDIREGFGAGTARVATDEEIRIPVMEEELTATVREQEAGAVRIEKDVVAEERTLDVPVTEERVRVERRVVDRPVTAADADAFEETVIDVPLRRETVDVQKQARVAEEVVVGKEAVQHTERVSDKVRKEEVFVDEDATLIDDREGRTGTTPTIETQSTVSGSIVLECSGCRPRVAPGHSFLPWDVSHQILAHDCTAHCP
jgi:uncharacterized protein (TIGR02271 family)